jgi:hypothetical protein
MRLCHMACGCVTWHATHCTAPWLGPYVGDDLCDLCNYVCDMGCLDLQEDASS